MVLMPINGFGITAADMRFQEAKLITQNSIILWHVSLANHVVFLDVLMLLHAP